MERQYLLIAIDSGICHVQWRRGERFYDYEQHIWESLGSRFLIRQSLFVRPQKLLKLFTHIVIVAAVALYVPQNCRILLCMVYLEHANILVVQLFQRLLILHVTDLVAPVQQDPVARDGGLRYEHLVVHLEDENESENSPYKRSDELDHQSDGVEFLSCEHDSSRVYLARNSYDSFL